MFGPAPDTELNTDRRADEHSSDRTKQPAVAKKRGWSHEETDRLASALPAGRTGWDGAPLSASDRRLFALREAGYSGPIDRDGYPDTTSKAAGILRDMAADRGDNPTW